MFDNVIQEIEQKARSSIFKEGDYEQDGFIHCGVCHERKQAEVTNPITGQTKKMPCVCRCIVEEREAEEKRIRAEANRRLAFVEADYRSCTFDKYEGGDPRTAKAMRNYADHFAELDKMGQGMILFGAVGTGKTFAAACIANKLLEDGHSVCMTSLSNLVRKIQKTTFDKADPLSDIPRYDLLILDDLGSERDTEYMKEHVFDIIDARYRVNKPIIVTTNLTWEQFNSPQSLSDARVYDRLRERCLPVEFKGKSRRNKQGRFDEMKAILNS